ncbi:hypothetical protein BJ875DRAFT_482090 [Amylocarpus encephaloides]|uniref:FeS cluster biogenesis domain-containing protein n=1 Tax=Amylocarpus encephaloides TaxID=45428 RepID=A0A9P7YN69_9HELO|nr:hypothetical protein BJ875DRAFT_482090 [Amylocarpus encephaloides]
MASRPLLKRGAHLVSSSSTCAARTFIQLAPRRYYPNTPPPVLDFLLPPSPQSFYAASVTRNRAIEPRSHARRAFTTSESRRGTIVAHNPLTDDDGNVMSMDITPRAANRLRSIMAVDNNPNFALRITVTSGGCAGFQYHVSHETLPPLNTSGDQSTISMQEQTPPAPNTPSSDPNAIPSTDHRDVKAQSDIKPLEEDETVLMADDGSEAKLVIDRASLDLLKDSKFDYTQELIASQFKVVGNPRAKNACGCGSSFDVKIDL